MLDPLLQLRGDLRQAVSTTVPAEARELLPLLDRALDELERHSQLDERGLEMAIEVICGALHNERPDTIEILKDRLSQAVRDYAAQAGTENFSEQELPDAFDSAEDLAAALEAMARGEIGVTAEGPAAVSIADERIDEQQLRRALKEEQQKGQHAVLDRIAKVIGVLRVVTIVAIVLVIVYVILHPQLLTKEVTQPPTPATPPSVPPTGTPE